MIQHDEIKLPLDLHYVLTPNLKSRYGDLILHKSIDSLEIRKTEGIEAFEERSTSTADIQNARLSGDVRGPKPDPWIRKIILTHHIEDPPKNADPVQEKICATIDHKMPNQRLRGRQNRSPLMPAIACRVVGRQVCWNGLYVKGVADVALVIIKWLSCSKVHLRNSDAL